MDASIISARPISPVTISSRTDMLPSTDSRSSRTTLRSFSSSVGWNTSRGLESQLSTRLLLPWLFFFITVCIARRSETVCSPESSTPDKNSSISTSSSGLSRYSPTSFTIIFTSCGRSRFFMSSIFSLSSLRMVATCTSAVSICARTSSPSFSALSTARFASFTSFSAVLAAAFAARSCFPRVAAIALALSNKRVRVLTSLSASFTFFSCSLRLALEASCRACPSPPTPQTSVGSLRADSWPRFLSMAMLWRMAYRTPP